MKLLSLMAASISAFALVRSIDITSSVYPPRVNISSGILEGVVKSTAPSVHQFLGVPYALPPTGSRRWLPPMKPHRSRHYLADDIGPACPQQPLRNTWVYSVNGGNRTQFFPLEDYSEDCLTLNIWTPSHRSKGMPVIIWFFGGGFVQGGTNSLYFNPQKWVERTKEHIVVTVNFRSNIFGYPNAPGLDEQNLGLLDQRAALEWIRDNIRSFGGDPSRMINWGESSGAIGIDFLNFVHNSDPIVSGMILSSGTALFEPEASVSSDTKHANFLSVVDTVGCGQAAVPLECMREVSWRTIEGALSSNTKLTFLPTVDNRTIFANYTSKYAQGDFSSIPAIIGTNQHELNAITPQPPGVQYNNTHVDSLANMTFLCSSAVKAARFRTMAGNTTYRYRYDGDFVNISPREYPGAFHASELPLAFGTSGDYHGAVTAYQSEVGQKLQDLYLAFANDPEHGLRDEGWPTYAEGKAVLLGGSMTPLEQIDVVSLDGGCSFI